MTAVIPYAGFTARSPALDQVDEVALVAFGLPYVQPGDADERGVDQSGEHQPRQGNAQYLRGAEFGYQQEQQGQPEHDARQRRADGQREPEPRAHQRADVADAEPGLLVDLPSRSEEHTSELQSRENLVCRLLLEKKKHLGKWQ